jgi:hypothetical protein
MIDLVGTVLLLALLYWLTRTVADHLIRGDTQRNRDNLCPPHEWVQTYMDAPGGRSVPSGLRCINCKRRPNGLPQGESWYGG